MIYKTSKLIAQAFDESSVKYKLEEVENFSIVTAAFEIEAGPTVAVNYISDSDLNDVNIFIHGLLHRIPASKRAAILEACNSIHSDAPLFIFYLDSNSNLNVKTELLPGIGDDCIGKICCRIFFLSMIVLDDIYPILTNALYSSNSDKPTSSSLVAFLREMRKNPIPVDSEQYNGDKTQSYTDI